MTEAQAVEADVNKRGELPRQLQRHLLEQAYLFMPATEVSVWAAWPRVEGFHPNDALSEYSFWAKVTVQD